MGWRFDKFNESLKFRLRGNHPPRFQLPRLQGEIAPSPVDQNHPSDEKEPTFDSIHSLDRLLS